MNTLLPPLTHSGYRSSIFKPSPVSKISRKVTLKKDLSGKRRSSSYNKSIVGSMFRIYQNGKTYKNINLLDKISSQRKNGQEDKTPIKIKNEKTLKMFPTTGISTFVKKTSILEFKTTLQGQKNENDEALAKVEKSPFLGKFQLSEKSQKENVAEGPALEDGLLEPLTLRRNRSKSFNHRENEIKPKLSTPVEESFSEISSSSSSFEEQKTEKFDSPKISASIKNSPFLSSRVAPGYRVQYSNSPMSQSKYSQAKNRRIFQARKISNFSQLTGTNSIRDRDRDRALRSPSAYYKYSNRATYNKAKATKIAVFSSKKISLDRRTSFIKAFNEITPVSILNRAKNPPQARLYFQSLIPSQMKVKRENSSTSSSSSFEKEENQESEKRGFLRFSRNPCNKQAPPPKLKNEPAQFSSQKQSTGKVNSVNFVPSKKTN